MLQPSKLYFQSDLCCWVASSWALPHISCLIFFAGRQVTGGILLKHTAADVATFANKKLCGLVDKRSLCDGREGDPCQGGGPQPADG